MDYVKVIYEKRLIETRLMYIHNNINMHVYVEGIYKKHISDAIVMCTPST